MKDLFKVRSETVKEILLYIFIGFLVYLYDIFKTKYDKDCTNTFRKKIYFNINVLIHHIVASSFLTFGWLSTNKTILIWYFIIAVYIYSHWKLLDNQCIISINASDLCNGNYNFYTPIILPYDTRFRSLILLFVIYKIFKKK